MAALIDLDDVALGTGGFKIQGEVAGDYAGCSVALAGDINGDGVDDLIIGAYRHDSSTGAAYVVFGRDVETDGGFTSPVSLAAIAGGSGGFKIVGEDDGDFAGFSVSSAGDINGDGKDDLIVGAHRNGSPPGAAYVVFGRDVDTEGGFTSPVSLAAIAAGSGGFKIVGGDDGDYAGYSVSSAGDINGDGKDDLIVGAIFGDDGVTEVGAAFVVFGRDADTEGGFTSPVSLTAIAAGTGGFVMIGEANVDLAGCSVSSAGDVNGDGKDDLIVGARRNGATYAGAAYLVFGRDVDTEGGFTSPVSLAAVAAGSGGFKIAGEGEGDAAGWSVSSAGDVNGDGFDDLIVGAPRNGPPGAAYVVFGRDVDTDGAFTSPVSLAAIAAGSGGFKIQGEAGGDYAGWSVSSAGDVNGDGKDDLIVGAHRNGSDDAGAAYVVFGRDADTEGGFTSPVSLAAIAAGTGGFKIQGETGGDRAGRSVSAAGDVNGDGFDDLIVGAPGQDSGGTGAGAAYVIYGFAAGPTARDDSFTTGENSVLAGNVITNTDPNGADSDPDFDALTVVAVKGVESHVGTAVAGSNGGLFSIAADGTLTFDPHGEFESLGVGETLDTSVTYTISDGGLTAHALDSATVTVTVQGANDAPVARDDGFITGEDTTLTGRNVITNTLPTGADSDVDATDTLVVSAVAGLAGHVGTAVAGNNGGLFSIAAGGALSFDPNGAFESLGVGESATTSVDYTLSDGHGGTDTATATVTVQGANDGPVARDDGFTTGEDTTLTGRNVITNLLPNGADSDVDGDALTVVGVGVVSGQVGAAVAGSSGGTFTIQANGALSFDPGSAFQTLFAGQQATSWVDYTVSDGQGGTDTARATVIVQGANEADIFTAGNDSRDLNAYNLAAYTAAQATQALGGKDVVQLSHTQNFGLAFHGNAGNDTITGGNAGDRIHGDAAADRLFGGNGADFLWGGAGNDTVSGGNGSDVFAWERGEGAQTDRVLDFVRDVDHIDLSAILDLGQQNAGNLQLTVVSSGQMRVRVDTDHNGSLDLQIDVLANNASGWNVGAVGGPGAEIWLG